MAATALLAAFILTRQPIPLSQQPFPDASEYADSARNLAHGHGYTTTVLDQPGHAEGYNPPRYPPGYSLLLAPFALVGDYPGNVQTGEKVVTVALLLACEWAAFELGGAWAALGAAVLVGLSPFTYQSSRLEMSDALAAALAVTLMPLLHRGGGRAAFLAGFVAGFGVLVHLPGVIVLVALPLALRGRDRLTALVGAAPPVIGLAAYQWVALGAPWRTGYSYWLPHLQAFSLSAITSRTGPGDGPFVFPDLLHGRLAAWACQPCRAGGPMQSLPSWLFYPLLLAGVFWVFTPPLLSLLGAGVAALGRRTPVGRLVVAVTAGHLIVLPPYFYQAARFMAAPMLMLAVLASVAIPRLVARAAPAPPRPPSASARGVSERGDVVRGQG